MVIIKCDLAWWLCFVLVSGRSLFLSRSGKVG